MALYYFFFFLPNMKRSSFLSFKLTYGDETQMSPFLEKPSLTPLKPSTLLQSKAIIPTITYINQKYNSYLNVRVVATTVSLSYEILSSLREGI